MQLKLTFSTLRANSLLLANFFMRSLINTGWLTLPSRAQVLARLVLSVETLNETQVT